MKSLAYDLTRLTTSHREGSHSTQQARRAILKQTGECLGREFKGLRGRGIKQRHIRHAVGQWKAEGISAGTIKNRLAHLRWATTKMGRANVVQSNEELGVGKRSSVASESKAVVLPAEKLEKLDPNIRASLELEASFGLRREEAIKFIPSYADKDESILLKGSWTKGGRPREVPISNLEQRTVLDKAQKIAKGGSLIPAEKTYKSQVALYEKQVKQILDINGHGLRHAYAQRRYFELTGHKAPVAGGKSDPAPAEVDRQARQEIAEELGHNRVQITVAYLGR